LIEQAAKKNDVEVAVRIPSVLKPIFCDENQITEVLLNIFMNAIESMVKGGKLTVTATAEPSFPSGEEQVVVVISDSGPGMGSAELARCFERYYTTKTTGTGLGLAIVQRIVQAHDGDVTAESSPGQGTKFTLRFPVR
jgi:two-component system sensor histidine kinase HydH